MGLLFSSPPKPPPKRSKTINYRYPTLDLKELVQQMVDKQLKHASLTSLLRQIPYGTNYCYDLGTKRVCSHGRAKFLYSRTPIATHLRLKGLTHSCIILLTKKQHGQVKVLKRCLTRDQERKE